MSDRIHPGSRRFAQSRDKGVVLANCTATATNSAALVVSNYSGGGQTDWFLPSRCELQQVYNNRTVVGVPEQNS